jgi:hypothetical protein
MSAVLRAYGKEFDVDSFIVDSSLPICAVKRREKSGPAQANPGGRRRDRSGVHVDVSKAEFDNFSQQVEDAIAFLQANDDGVRRLCEWPGVEDAEIDFGISRRSVAVQSDCLPTELLRLAGNLGLDIVMSQYEVTQ